MAALSLGLASNEALGASLSSALPSTAQSDLGLFILDTSIAGADRLDENLRLAGITSVHYSGDVGTPWLSHIEPMWRTRPRPIAGLTFGGAFFCLEHLARTYGLTCTLSSPPSELAQVRPPHSSADAALAETMLHAATITSHGDAAGLGAPRVEDNKPLLWRLQPKSFAPAKTSDRG